MDFSIVLDYELYPTAILEGHVVLADTGYNGIVLHCRRSEDVSLTKAVELALSDEHIGVVETMGT